MLCAMFYRPTEFLHLVCGNGNIQKRKEINRMERKINLLSIFLLPPNYGAMAVNLVISCYTFTFNTHYN